MANRSKSVSATKVKHVRIPKGTSQNTRKPLLSTMNKHKRRMSKPYHRQGRP